jgi:DNA-binding GntR family transcriptional regulator
MTAPRSATVRTRKPQQRASSRRIASTPVAQSPPDDANGHRFSRSAWLADILRQRIVTGQYQPGERIREAQLRTEFGFSNGPIREALQAIVADGLAERAPWHGVRIKVLSEKQIIELFQVRVALLEYAAERAAKARSPAMVESAGELKRGLDAGFASMKSEAHPSFQGHLSQWLLASAGNDALRAIWEKTMLQTLVYVNASLMKARGAKNRALIHQLIDQICAGKVAPARATAREMTRQTLADLGIEGDV